MIVVTIAMSMLTGAWFWHMWCDNTPVCTKQMCSYRDSPQAFAALDATIVGISAQDLDSHRGFIEKNNLTVPLLADVDKKIVAAYGVWGEKTFMGRKYLGTHRVTFLIGPDGRIKKIWPQVKPEEHAAEVLAAL